MMFRTIAILSVAIGLGGGCGPRPSNLSPIADEDPPRLRRALHEADAVRRANRLAEEKFYRRLGRIAFDPPEDGTTDSPPTFVGGIPTLARTGDETP